MSRKIMCFVCFFFIIAVKVHSEMCQHCQGPAHHSINEECLQCNRKLEECTFFHTIIPQLTVEEIISADHPSLLMDILFKLKEKYKVFTGKNLPSHEIFKKGNEIFAENKIILPKTGLKILKDIVKKREKSELYVSRCRELRGKNEINKFIQKILLEDQATISHDLDDEISYPLKLKCGVFLTWCGCAMTILSDGILAPAGKWVASTGAVMCIDGMIEYNERLNERERQQVVNTKNKLKKK